jgi:hypothetical protein
VQHLNSGDLHPRLNPRSAAIREQSIKEDELVFVWTIRQLVTLQLILTANI